MNQKNQIDWTSGEIGNLWNIYIANSMAVTIFEHFLLNVENTAIKDCLVSADALSRNILLELKEKFTQEGIQIPEGFTEKDVNKSAPRLFSDSFYIKYLNLMVKLGGIFYSISSPSISRMDLRHFITEANISTIHLSNQVTQVLLDNGLYIRPPYIPKPKAIEYVKKQSFFNGFYGDKRPLSGMEISHIFSNIQVNAIKTGLIIGFAQVAKSKDVRNFFLRGKNINVKQEKILSQFLYQENVVASFPGQYNITDSLVAPFSDKLMMFLITNLSSAKVRNFGDSIAVSPRHDLVTTYSRFLAETGNFAEDGGNIMIENGWMETPPHNVDREKLAKLKKRG